MDAEDKDFLNMLSASLDDPPANEHVYEIPEPVGTFQEKLQKLKESAFKESMASCFNTRSVSRKKKSQQKLPIKLTGFFAFKSYYKHYFYDLPVKDSAKYFSKAWKACPDKHIWQSYARQYNRYQRVDPFVDWLHKSKKIPRPEPLIFIQEKF